MDTRNKDFTVEESNVDSVLGHRMENIDFKAHFDVFSEKLTNYLIQKFKNPGDIVDLVRDMRDPRSTFDNKHNPKNLPEDQEKSMLQKIIHKQTIKLFVTR